MNQTMLLIQTPTLWNYRQGKPTDISILTVQLTFVFSDGMFNPVGIPWARSTSAPCLDRQTHKIQKPTRTQEYIYLRTPLFPVTKQSLWSAVLLIAETQTSAGLLLSYCLSPWSSSFLCLLIGRGAVGSSFRRFVHLRYTAAVQSESSQPQCSLIYVEG